MGIRLFLYESKTSNVMTTEKNISPEKTHTMKLLREIIG